MAPKSQAFNWGLFSEAGLRSIAESTARINIWEGAVRSAKTISSIVRWLEYVQTAPPGDLMMLGKTERTLASNILNTIEAMVGPRRWKYNRGTGEAILFGRRILIRGANDVGAEAKIRGATIAGFYGDELTLWPVEIFKQLLARMSVEGAMGFGTTNPDSPFHWLKADFLDKEDLDLRQFHFELTDNPNLPTAYVEALKREYTGLWYKRFILGLWVQAEGAVYDMFDPDIHVVASLPADWDQIYEGVDYGTSNPTAFVSVGYDRDKRRWVAFREYYYDSRAGGNRQKSDSEFSTAFREHLGGLHPQSIEIDPSAASFKVQLRNDGVQRIHDADHAVIDGIRVLGRALSNGELVIHKSCRHLIEEMSNYSWDEKAQRRGEDKPVKQHDHAPDALRYVAMRIFGRRHLPILAKAKG